jgi:hypothetical protein
MMVIKKVGYVAPKIAQIVIRCKNRKAGIVVLLAKKKGLD